MFVSSGQRDDASLEPPAAYLKERHRVVRRAPALGRAAGIDDPDLAVPLELREMRVAVDDRVAARKPGDEPLLPAGARTCDMHEPDPEILDLYDPTLGKGRLQRRLVDVAPDGLDRRERLQLVEHARSDDVASVQDQVGLAELPQALVRKPARASRKVRVRDDRDPRQL
jgi:hypothetical protein